MIWPCQSWVMVAQRPFFIGNPGWVRPSAWIWLPLERTAKTPERSMRKEKR
jgi:hypothetical protein